jgi:hypothetical protein
MPNTLRPLLAPSPNPNPPRHPPQAPFLPFAPSFRTGPHRAGVTSAVSNGRNSPAAPPAHRGLRPCPVLQVGRFTGTSSISAQSSSLLALTTHHSLRLTQTHCLLCTMPTGQPPAQLSSRRAVGVGGNTLGTPPKGPSRASNGGNSSGAGDSGENLAISAVRAAPFFLGA